MKDVLYLAWRYLVWHRFKTSVLVGAITLVVFLPWGLQLLIERTADDMTARAAATPLLLGARGSPLELTLSSLYFSAERPDFFDFSAAGALAGSGLAQPIPLYVRFRARGYAIVGTSPDYFEHRRLELDSGRGLVQLGDAVLGAGVAAALGLGAGDSIVSAPESLFDFAGVYPLKMPVVGVLKPGHTRDDMAVFVDLKTAWVIAGLGHGHQDLDSGEAAGAVLAVEEDRIVANASLVQFNEITEANRHSFHFHGDLGSYPVSAVIPVAGDAKSRTLLLGRYQDHPTLQMIEPGTVMDDLLETVFAVQRYVLLAMGMVGVATFAVVVLVFVLSLRLRRGEMLTMVRLGGARGVIGSLMLAEVALVLLMSLACAGLLTLATVIWGEFLLRALLFEL